MKKILFIYSGAREKLNDDIADKKSPDTQLYGMNYLKGDFAVSSKEFSDTFFGRVFGTSISFRIKHILMFFSIKDTDIVFGSSLFYTTFFKKIFFSKKKFVLFNTSLNRFLNQTQKKSRFLYSVYKSFLKEIDIIVSLSNSQLEELYVRHGISRDKLIFIPLGVDVDFYKPIFENRKEYILAVGRDNGRDYKSIVEASRRLPGTEFHLVLSRRNLVGVGELPSNVKVFFDLPFSDLRQKYIDAKMLLLITHPDGFQDGSDCSGQTVLLDAYASGIPVIATKKAYLSDYGLPEQDYMIVEPYDVSGIIKAIMGIENSIARHAYTTVTERFSTEKMGEKLSSLFNKI